jgi:hypothetical protein
VQAREGERPHVAVRRRREPREALADLGLERRHVGLQAVQQEVAQRGDLRRGMAGAVFQQATRFGE